MTLSFAQKRGFGRHDFMKVCIERVRLGARLRGRTATQRQRSKIRVLRRFCEGFLGRGSQKGSEKGACYGFYSNKRVLRRVLRGVLRRHFPEGAWNAPLRSTPL